jgi:tetratricopeptide (TPR) repeat protein/transcriptional regulator with XRE-family HTH domain
MEQERILFAPSVMHFLERISEVASTTLLKRYRRAAGLTQEALAERALISADTISDLERGVNLSPRSDTIDQLVDALALAPAQRAQLHAAARGLQPGEPTVVPLRLPAASTSLPPLVGREQELKRLARHLAGEGPPLLLLAGEPGIGKSRLLDEVQHQASQGGWSVLQGGCHRKSGQEPFTPLLSALAGSLRHTSPAALRTRLEGCGWLVRLLPELAETRLVPAPSWTLPADQERRLMFAAVARYLANVAGPAGTLLVLDDLQWAGADALDLLASLLRAPGELPLRIVGAYRSTEVRPPDPLGVLLADLGAAGQAEEARLGPLATEEASALLQSMLAARANADAALRAHLLRRTGGVPYFLVSCAEALRVSTQEGRPAEALPWNVAQSIGQRVAALPAAAHELLGVATVVGRETPDALLLALAGQPTAETVTALEALDRARLLIEGAEASYQFPHDLIREVVLSELSAVRRARVHQQVAAVLEQMPERQREGRAAALAWHWQEAGDAERALPYALLAGEQAEAVYAHQDAERHYQTAHDLARELGDQRQEAAALEKLGVVCELLARFSQAEEQLEAALALYQATGDVEGQGRTLARLGQVHAVTWTPEPGIAWIQPRLAPLCTGGLSLSGQATLSIALGWLYGIAERFPESLAAAEQAVALAQQAQDDRLLGQAQMWRGFALLRLERWDEGLAVLEEAIALLEAIGDLYQLMVALINRSNAYQVLGDFEQARRSNERVLELAERIGSPSGIAYHTMQHADLAFQLGEWRQARLDCNKIATLTQDVEGLSWQAGWSLHQLGVLSQAEGQQEPAFHALHQTLALAEREGHQRLLLGVSVTLAEWDLLAGRAEAVCVRLESLLARSDRGGDVDGRLALLHLLGRAYMEQGAVEQAEALLTKALTQATALRRRFRVMEVRRAQGLLELRQARWPEAAQALEEALALCQGMHTPYEEAKTLSVAGELHRAKGEPIEARERWEAALSILHRLGERLFAEQIEQALAHLGPQEGQVPS